MITPNGLSEATAEPMNDGTYKLTLYPSNKTNQGIVAGLSKEQCLEMMVYREAKEIAEARLAKGEITGSKWLIKELQAVDEFSECDYKMLEDTVFEAFEDLSPEPKNAEEAAKAAAELLRYNAERKEAV
jgi:hypothetical protein